MKIFNSFFVGLILTLAPIFTLFAGLKLNYFDYYGIAEYFNIIFADNVPFLWLVPLALAVGYAFFYAPFRRIFRAFYVAILLGSLASWQGKAGLWLGEKIFMSEPYEIIRSYNKDNEPYIATARTVYVGRDSVYLLFDGATKAEKQKKASKKDTI